MQASAEKQIAVNAKKIVVIGSGGCGKTHLIRAFIEVTDSQESARNFRKAADSSITVDGTDFPLVICEAPCLQKHRGERSQMYEDADVILMCFAVNDMQSFLCLTSVWLRELQENRPALPFVVIGNKGDLKSQARAPRTISYNNGLLTARNLKAFQYVECSAYTKEGVLDAFIAAVKATL